MTLLTGIAIGVAATVGVGWLIWRQISRDYTT